jgi:hypothetical protein
VLGIEANSRKQFLGCRYLKQDTLSFLGGFIEYPKTIKQIRSSFCHGVVSTIENPLSDGFEVLGKTIDRILIWTDYDKQNT